MIEKSEELVNSLKAWSNQSRYEDLYQGLVGVVNTIGNSIIVKLF